MRSTRRKLAKRVAAGELTLAKLRRPDRQPGTDSDEGAGRAARAAGAVRPPAGGRSRHGTRTTP